MQTEISQPEGKRIMPETRITSFPALSVDPRVGISGSALETGDYFSYILLEKTEALKRIFKITLLTANPERHSAFFRSGA